MRSSFHRPGDDPALDDEQWVEYGGELIRPVGFTPGSARHDPAHNENQRPNARPEFRAGWARARAALERSFESCSSPDTKVAVGRVKSVGRGLSREVYAAHVDLSPDADGCRGVWAVLLPGRGATPRDCRRWVREVAVLGQLAREKLPFRVPEPLGVFREEGRPALIRRFLDGIPADLREGRMPSVRPVELVGRIAAAIHAIDVTDWPRRPPGGPNRLEHATEALHAFDELEGSEIGQARAWAQEHLPPDHSSVLVHGDLLGQNILLSSGEGPGVIDWEFCRMGDPAYDLAIVTRGVRRPFQMASGLDRLLDAYAAAGGSPIARSGVHFHELCMAALWYREALRDENVEPPEQALARLRGILRRAEESTR